MEPARVIVVCPKCKTKAPAGVGDKSWCYCRPAGTLMRPETPPAPATVVRP